MASELSEAEVELPGVGSGDESARRCMAVFGSGGYADAMISRCGCDQRSAIKRASSFLFFRRLSIHLPSLLALYRPSKHSQWPASRSAPTSWSRWASSRSPGCLRDADRPLRRAQPDGVQRGLVGNIIGRFEQRGFKLIALKLVHATPEHLEKRMSSP